MVDFILQRRWFPATLLPGLMRWLKIGPLLNPHLTHAVSLLGFFHRSGGRLVNLPPDINNASRLEQNVEAMWMSLQSYLSFSQCQQLYGLERDIKHSGTLAHQFNQLLKSIVIPALITEAQDHVASRIQSLACPTMPAFSYLEWLCSQTLHVNGAVPRFSVLRWTLGEDSDLWFTIRTSPHLPNTRTHPCCNCGSLGRNYPLGPHKGVLCNDCCPVNVPWYLAFVTDADRDEFASWTPVKMPAVPESVSPLLQVVNDTTSLGVELHSSSCPLCNVGPNTIDHWIHYCRVPHMVLNALLRSTPWVHMTWVSPSSDMVGILQTHLLFHMRRLVREKGALSPGQQTIPMSMSAACRLLARTVWESLASSVAEKVWAPPGSFHSQCTFRDGLVHVNIPAVHLNSVVLPKSGLYLSSNADKGQVLAVLSPHDPFLRHFLQHKCSGSLPQAQVFLSHFKCECGAFHIRVSAAESIAPFQFLALAQSQYSSSLLIQFDGSARQSCKIGGAGIAVLKVTPDVISVVSWHAYALNKCKDNIYAEAFGCLEALRMAHLHVQTALQAGISISEVTVQGDILPIVNLLTFKGRFRRLDVLPLLEQCQTLLARLPFLNLEYRPRECNKFADHCAGLGTKAASADKVSEFDFIPVDPPFELCSSLGFLISDAFPSSPFDRVFAEKHLFSVLNLKVLHNHPTFVKSFARYRRHFCTSGASVMVQYRPTAFDQGGRSYAQTPSAQLFPKPLRISLFGHTHSDIDMIQAHYELVRRISRSQHLLPAWQMRRWLKDTWSRFNIPAFPNLEKLWPTHLLNMASEVEMRNSLLKLGCGFIPDTLEEFIHHLHAAKTFVVDHPPSWCPPRQVDPGRGYTHRILENIERTVLLKFLDLLQSLMSVDSIVFIHDGFLISPEPSPARLLQAQEAVLLELDLFDPVQPLFKCVNLSKELSQLEQDLATTPCARIPDLSHVTLHSFWKTVAHKRHRAVFSHPAAVDCQETRLTKRKKGTTGASKRRMVSAPK